MTVVDMILGRTLASSEKRQEKIGATAGIPAMGLDSLSSAAYGPEAALTILAAAGAVGLKYIAPITLLTVALLAMLYVSYRQIIVAYPNTGGAYTVASRNLGTACGLLAAAALIIDYLLNVAVGISAGVGALVSVAPSLHRYNLFLCLAILAIITLLNLRGTGEAGLAFAIPTYGFILTMLGVVGIGLIKMIFAGGHPHAVVAPPPIPPATATIGLWLLLRSFAAGCTAMTGVEAVSNGVNAFKEPTVKYAHRTLTTVIVVLSILLAGVGFLIRSYHIGAMEQDKPGYQNVLSQLTAAIVGRGMFYYLAIGCVLVVLCLSANTSFVGFPRLCRLIAKDNYLPWAFASVGRRLVYSVGVLFLSCAAAALLIVFGGITDRLIPLLAVGAFIAFTISQAGMVVHWAKELHGGKHAAAIRLRMWVNAIGAIATGCTLVVIVIAKFTDGAWFTVLAIPSLMTLFYLVHRHYAKFKQQSATTEPMDFTESQPPVVLVPIRGWDRLTEKAIRFAMWLSTDVVAIHLSNLRGEDAAQVDDRVRQQWHKDVEIPAVANGLKPPQLIVVPDPFRDFLQPLVAQIDDMEAKYPDRKVAIVLPQVFASRWWETLLHSRRCATLRSALLKRGDSHVIVVDVPWYVKD